MPRDLEVAKTIGESLWQTYIPVVNGSYQQTYTWGASPCSNSWHDDLSIPSGGIRLLGQMADRVGL